MLLKRKLFCVMQCKCLCGLRLIKHYFPHTVHYCCSSMLHLSETRWFLQSSSFWEARCALMIGQLPSALWLAEYLKREMEMLRPLLYCDAEFQSDKTKTINIINKAFVASSGDIITDYNDLYCLFMCRVASHRVNISMSAFVIGETTNTTLHCSKLTIE